MANISLSQSLCNLTSSFNGMKDLSLTALSTLSSSIGVVSYSAEFNAAISDFKSFNRANTYYPDRIVTQATHSLNAFNGYDHYKNWIFQSGSAYYHSDGENGPPSSPDVQLAETTYGDSNIGHNPYRNAAIILSSSGEPVIVTAYRQTTDTKHKYCGHVIKNFDSGAYASSGGGTGSIQRLTIPEADTGVTNGAGINTHPIESGSALILMRNQDQSGKTYGQFVDAEGNLTSLTAVHTSKTNNFTSFTSTNFSQSAVAFITGRGNMEAKPSVVRKQGSTLNPDIAAEPTKPSGYSGFSCGNHGTLLAYRSGSDDGVVKKFFYVCWHSFGGNYKSNALFYATPSQTEYNSDTGTWATIGSSHWTLINDDWKSQTTVKGSSNVGDFVGKHPETGDDWIVWFSLIGEGAGSTGQTYCHSARITQDDSVTITDISSQLGLNELTGSRRYVNGASANAGGRCWQHFNIISKKDVTTEFILHSNHQGTGSAQLNHYNFDLRTGDLSLIAQLSASTRNMDGGSATQNGVVMRMNGMSTRLHPIPLGTNWNARDLYQVGESNQQTRHHLLDYADNHANVSKSGWVRGIYLETS
jgi:hypothetical protein